MDFKKAVITAAGPGQQTLPLHTLVDRDGREKTVLAVILEEAESAGIEDACIVIQPALRESYAAAIGETVASGLKVEFVEQASPLGYGHALFCARSFTGHDPFLHFVSDHLYVSREDRSCAKQLIDVAERESAAVSAVQATRESWLVRYGTVAAQRRPGSRNLYSIGHVLEKPTPTQAEQELLVPGLRAGHYLCFFGMHALPPSIMELLAEEVAIAAAEGRHCGLSPALDRLASQERYLAFETAGLRYDIGIKYGLLQAQIALALGGVDRNEVLTQMLELLALRERSGFSSTSG